MSVGQMVSVTCSPCFVCGIQSTIEVSSDGYQMRMSGSLVQTAFPDMPHQDREMLISGTHPECWMSQFGDDDDEEL